MIKVYIIITAIFNLGFSQNPQNGSNSPLIMVQNCEDVPDPYSCSLTWEGTMGQMVTPTSKCQWIGKKCNQMTEWLSIMQDMGYMTGMLDIGNVPGMYTVPNSPISQTLSNNQNTYYNGGYNQVLNQANPSSASQPNPPPTPVITTNCENIQNPFVCNVAYQGLPTPSYVNPETKCAWSGAKCNEMSDLLGMWQGKLPPQCGNQNMANLQPGFSQYSQQQQWYSGFGAGLLKKTQFNGNPQPMRYVGSCEDLVDPYNCALGIVGEAFDQVDPMTYDEIKCAWTGAKCKEMNNWFSLIRKNSQQFPFIPPMNPSNAGSNTSGNSAPPQNNSAPQTANNNPTPQLPQTQNNSTSQSPQTQNNSTPQSPKTQNNSTPQSPQTPINSTPQSPQTQNSNSTPQTQNNSSPQIPNNATPQSPNNVTPPTTQNMPDNNSANTTTQNNVNTSAPTTNTSGNPQINPLTPVSGGNMNPLIPPSNMNPQKIILKQHFPGLTPQPMTVQSCGSIVNPVGCNVAFKNNPMAMIMSEIFNPLSKCAWDGVQCIDLMSLMTKWNNVIPPGYIPSVNDAGFVPRIDGTDGLYSWSSMCGHSKLLKSSNPLHNPLNNNNKIDGKHDEYTKYVLIVLGSLFVLLYLFIIVINRNQKPEEINEPLTMTSDFI